MKTTLKLSASILPALLLISLIELPSTALAQGTAFTYQGRLNSGTNAANGIYDLTFALFNVSSGAGQFFSNFSPSAICYWLSTIGYRTAGA